MDLRTAVSYDWTYVASHFVGFESIYHKLREKITVYRIRSFSLKQPCVDVGCGTALITRHFPNMIGVDISISNLRKAKRYARCQFIHADANHLPIKTESCSLVLCTQVLEHLPNNPSKCLDEIDRILSSRGTLLVSVPKQSVFWFFQFLSRTKGKEKSFHWHYTLRDFKKMMSRFSLLKTHDYFAFLIGVATKR